MVIIYYCSELCSKLVTILVHTGDYFMIFPFQEKKMAGIYLLLLHPFDSCIILLIGCTAMVHDYQANQNVYKSILY